MKLKTIEAVYAHSLVTEEEKQALADKNHEIRTKLYDGVWHVTFTKVNGESRTMPCTLDSKLMPPPVLVEFHKTKVYNPETLSVWCTDKSQWRSFRVSNVSGMVKDES